MAGNPLKDKKVAKCPVLQALLETSVSEKPADCRKRLCAAGFHCKSKEIENYRGRQAAAVRAQGLPQLGVNEMLARLEAADMDDLFDTVIGMVRACEL